MQFLLYTGVRLRESGQHISCNLANVFSCTFVGANLVVPLSWCPHLETCLAGEAPRTMETKAPCIECANVGENWVCLKVRSNGIAIHN